ncbi:4Fe-4S binding protein [Hyphobacterium sp. CCMP332]|nr:4Fe-4S binding protein [Hyphobacterium sp. CCMP332]
MIKAIKISGLVLFLIGFSLFLSSFFLGYYKIDKNIIIDNAPSKPALEAMLNSSKNFLNQKITSPFQFVSKLSSSIEKSNNEILLKFGFNKDQLEKLISPYKNNEKIVFSLQKSLDLALENDPEKEYKKESFREYGSWLDQREYSNIGKLKEDIEGVIQNIEKYKVTKEYGIDKYSRKSLLYSLSKASNNGPVSSSPLLFIILTYGLCIIGAVLYILPKLDSHPGIKNNHIFHRAMSNVGWLGVLTGSFLILFYIFLYYFPEYMTSWIIMVDPISQFIKNADAGRFFLYGFIYTLCILIMGIRMIIKYRHSRYQIIRTISVMFFQTAFAFLIPEILLRLNKPYFDFKNIWPLDYDFFFGNELNVLIESGALGLFMLFWGIALIIIAVPVFVFFFGKRWYCSWVCGCGGLAETLGDPYRQLSDKSLRSWQIERYMIHGVLVFAVIMTAAVLYTFFTGESELLGFNSYSIRETYGAWIGAGFAGVVGTGFYPLMGNRVWCRFGCPLAAYLGIVQKFKSRFRITTNGGQCISCGNCSTYCEMGIDVRWYAQRGQNIIRSSCVGCGVCSSVCPRGVLNLELKDEEGRYNEPILIGMDRAEVAVK